MASDLPWKEHVQAIKAWFTGCFACWQASHAPRVAQTHEVPVVELKKKEKARRLGFPSLCMAGTAFRGAAPSKGRRTWSPRRALGPRSA